nr:MAG: heat shock protein 90 [Plant associated crinivirus 1]
MNVNPSYSWGNLFKCFYGHDDGTKYLEYCSSNFNPNVLTVNHKLKNDRELSVIELRRAKGTNVTRELALLYFSETVYKVCELCGFNASVGFRGLESYTRKELHHGELVTEEELYDKTCKFSLATIINRFPTVRKRYELEHIWALSNSCGSIVNLNEISKYKELVFSGIESDKFEVKPNNYSEFLGYCLGVYKSEVLVGSKEKVLMYETPMNWIRRYYSTTNLDVTNDSTNLLLLGVCYEFIKTTKAFSTTFRSNCEKMQNFITDYAPLISKLWEFEGTASSQDPRLLVPLTSDDLMRDIRKLSLLDLLTTVGTKLYQTEIILTSEMIDNLTSKIDAILTEDNKDTPRKVRWAALFCYYAEYRTSRTRVEPRPDYYSISIDGVDYSVNMQNVEGFFSSIQSREHDVNFRRQFNGSYSRITIPLLKRLKIRLKPIVNIDKIVDLDYLNVDYYKHLCHKDLTAFECEYIDHIRARVKFRCNSKLISLKGNNTVHPSVVTLVDKRRNNKSHKKYTSKYHIQEPHEFIGRFKSQVKFEQSTTNRDSERG